MTESLIRAYYAAYNALDVDALSALLDPDVALESAAGTQVGREAYLATYDFMTSRFIDQMEPQRIEMNGKVASVRIRDVLTARVDVPDFMGQSISKGQQLILELAGRYTIENGRIVRIELQPA